MMTNMLIDLGDFNNVSAQQIGSIIIQCSALYHTEFDFLRLFICLRPGKMSLKTLHFFYPLEET